MVKFQVLFFTTIVLLVFAFNFFGVIPSLKEFSYTKQNELTTNGKSEDLTMDDFPPRLSEEQIANLSLAEYQIISANYTKHKINLEGLKIINRITSRIPENICDADLPNLRQSFFFSKENTLKKRLGLEENRFALATLASAGDEYVKMAVVLLYSYKKVMKLKVDFIALVKKDNVLSNESKCLLVNAGWKLVEVEAIGQIKLSGEPFQTDQFMKYQFAKMVEYDKILYLDSDCLILQNVDELFYVPTDFAATINTGPRFKTPYINTGLIVFRPSLCLYYTILINTKNVSEYGDFAEQDYLNWLMEHKVWRLSLNYNAAHHIYLNNKQLWNKELKTNQKIIHYSWKKPWHIDNELTRMWFRMKNETWNNLQLEECSNKNSPFSSILNHRVK